MSKPQHRKPPLRGPRPYKGKSLMAAVDDYVVIDIETTGLVPGLSEIIELGAVRVQKGRIVDEFATLVRPRGVVSPFITELTGITNAMVGPAPMIEAALPGYLDFIGKTLVIGHNVHFDVNFIYDQCVAWLERPFPNDFIDTMRMSRRLYKHERGHRLCNLAERFGVADNGMRAHRALADVIKTHHCYEYMKAAALSDARLLKMLRDQKLFPAHAQLQLFESF